jgi:N-methylhydantoinase B
MDEYGIDDLVPVSRAICEQSERAVRRRIAEIPDGTYRNRVQIEAVGDPVSIACTIEKRGDAIAIDFAGSSDCIRAGINVPFCYARAMAIYSIKCITAPSIPNNEGSVAPITVTAPEGCILNAQPPSPTAGRHVVGHFVTPLIFGALADAVPDRVQADCGMINIITVQGKRPDGDAISTLYFVAGGFGALDGLDGAPTTPGPSNMACVPTEIWESRTGITVERKALRPPGGPAATVAARPGNLPRNDTGHLLTVFDGEPHRLPGGRPARRRCRRLREHRLRGGRHPKSRQELKPGDGAAAGGGGGIGDPRQSDPAPRRDVENGFVSREDAERIYGLPAE